MVSRRALLTGSLVAGAGSLAIPARPAVAKAVMTDDGIYREDWFIDTFLELADDLQNTVASGKQLAVIWELRGCPYCRATHLVNFAQPDIERYVRDHFDILELNIVGSRIVTDFDGQQLGEKQLAAKYGVRYTPTIQFFPDHAADLAKKPPREREVNRIQGYLAPKDFIHMFAYVADHGYERGTLRDYLRHHS
jgi:thioredoxin-related protein